MACKSCRFRKIKCDQTRPVCQNCSLRSIDCTYAGERRTKRWIRAGINSRRFSVIRNSQDRHLNGADAQQCREIVVHQPEIATASEAPASSTPMSEPSAPNEARQTQQVQDVDMIQSQPQWSQMEPSLMSFGLDQMGNDGMAVLQTPTSSNISEAESLLDRILEGDDVECAKDRNPAVWMRASDGDEYTGPSSGISTISDPGLNWVRQNVADSQVLCETIQDIRNGVLNHLRQPKCIPKLLSLALATPCGPKETPNPLLLRYVEAYFDTVQVIFPILDRDKFFSQLKEFGASQRTSQNPSWEALLNAVLASGCRAALSAETAKDFQESGREAWGYFHRALSFESRILHGSTDLIGVQAMAVMTVFAQGLSSPQRLEYTLCSVASRLAQSLALNCRPPPEWDLTEVEQRERNRVFWVIYCLDRSIALRCGRPAVICDDDVSCCFPRNVAVIQRRGDTPRAAAAKAADVDFFLCFTKLSRICGKVSRMLYSESALYTSSSRLLPAMNHLLQDLHSWLDLIPAGIRPGQPPNRMTETFSLSRDQIIVLHLSYYYVLCAIYRRFTPIFTQDSNNLQYLVNNKLHGSHIEAARSIVLLTKHLDIESFTPAWLIFYYPFTALTTIFVHIVSTPPNDTTQSDLALMETVVGFFGRLEYVTSGEAAFTKTTEFVRQARTVTNRYSKDGDHTSQRRSSKAQSSSLPTEVAMQLQDSVDTAEGNQMQAANDAQVHQEIPVSGTANGQIPWTTPPLTEPLQDQEDSDTQRTNRGMDIIHHDQSLYSDLAGLLAPPPDDAIHVNWPGDWVSAV